MARSAMPVAQVTMQDGLKLHTWQRQHAASAPRAAALDAVIDEWMPSVRVGGGLSFAHYVNLRERRVRTLFIGRDVRGQALALAGPALRTAEVEASPTPSGGEPLLQMVRRALLLDAWVRKSIREGSSGGSLDEPATSILARRGSS